MPDNHPETSAQRVARAESELVDLEVRSPRLPDDVTKLVSEIRNEIGDQSPSRLWPNGHVRVRSASLSALCDAVEAQAAEIERLRARVAEYDALAKRAERLWPSVVRLLPHIPDDMAGLYRSLAALAPRGPGDSEGGR
jgi:hypothetical protein